LGSESPTLAVTGAGAAKTVGARAAGAGAAKTVGARAADELLSSPSGILPSAAVIARPLAETGSTVSKASGPGRLALLDD
jgi:hypothetical protein